MFGFFAKSNPIQPSTVESPLRKLVKAIAAQMPAFRSQAESQPGGAWTYNHIVVALDFLNEGLQEEGAGSVQRTWDFVASSIRVEVDQVNDLENAVATIEWATKCLASPTKIDVPKIDISDWWDVLK